MLIIQFNYLLASFVMHPHPSFAKALLKLNDWYLLAVSILTEREINKLPLGKLGGWTPVHLPSPTNQLIEWFNIRLTDFKIKLVSEQGD